MISGLIVVFAYHPSLAFDSVQKINFLLPYGSFFRKLHYFSSEAFTLFLLLHVGLELIKHKVLISASSWNYSIFGFGLVIILMFSGFVLKADLSANAAAQVAFSLIKDTPFLKYFLALMQDSSVFYYKFFIWHILFLPLVLGYAIYKHIDTLHVKAQYLSIAFGLSILSLMTLSMPRDIISGEKVHTLTSPWFFEGAENLLLNSWSPLLVNLVIIFPFVLLVIYFYIKEKNIIKTLLCLWLISYILISVFAK
jgi:ubiquinol-cytochrome c reductase cytochrome b subunit